VALGAGEIVLNSIDADGTKAGFDLLITRRVSEAVGVPVDADWREPPASAAGPGARLAAGWLAARRQDARWAREHAAPWVSRRLRGVSSGDGIEPKRPELRPF